MGLLTDIIADKRSTGYKSSLSNPSDWLLELLHGNKSKVGMHINEEMAIRVMAVYVCINLIANAIACFPKPVFKNDKKARGHPLWNLLNYAANPEMTAFDFWKCIMVNALISRGGFAEIVTDVNGDITGLWPIPGQYVTLDRDKQKNLIIHVCAPDGQYYTLGPGQFFYLKGFTKDGLNTYLPITIAREAMGLSVALEQFGEEFFSNGANAGGIVEYPGEMTDTAFERYKSSFHEKFQGLGKSNRIIFLEQGIKYTQLTVPPNSGQFLESRKFQTIEVCRFFSVPPHKAFEYENVNYNTAEQANIEFVQTTLTPWVVSIEQVIWLYLFTPSEKKRMYMKSTMNALLRGDFQTRMNGYHMMRQDGVFTANNILELEDMETLTEEQGGNLLLCNGNMIPITMAGETQKLKQKGGNSNNGQKNTGTPAKGDSQQ